MRAYLISKGFSYDEAWSLPEDEMLAYYVVLGEFDGNKFNWRRMEWEKPNG